MATTVSGLHYVDLASTRPLMTGLTFDLDQCAPVLDHALLGLNEQTRIPNQLVAWIRPGACAAGRCPYDGRGRIIIDAQVRIQDVIGELREVRRLLRDVALNEARAARARMRRSTSEGRGGHPSE